MDAPYIERHLGRWTVRIAEAGADGFMLDTEWIVCAALAPLLSNVIPRFGSVAVRVRPTETMAGDCQ